MNINDIKSELAQWQDMWDKVSDKFASMPGVISNAHTQTVKDYQADDKVDILSEEVDWRDVSERVSKIFNKDISTQGNMYALRPNPIHTSSKGKDQELRVTPNFTDGEELRELNKTKMELHDLEGRLLASEIQGKEIDSLKKQLNELKDKFEILSNSLTPNQEEDVT